ncbi:hypothetical protein [Nostoc sp. PA-18-2419]|nr:hypothetical protein [Nostoc sp. PA-18-2419]
MREMLRLGSPTARCSSTSLRDARRSLLKSGGTLTNREMKQTQGQGE